MHSEEMWDVGEDWICRLQARKGWCIVMNLRVY